MPKIELLCVGGSHDGQLKSIEDDGRQLVRFMRREKGPTQWPRTPSSDTAETETCRLETYRLETMRFYAPARGPMEPLQILVVDNMTIRDAMVQVLTSHILQVGG